MLWGIYRAIMFAGHLVCHQMPERSPHILGVQFPLCWRCTGIAIGSIVFLIILFYRRRLIGFRLSLALAVLMPLDVFTAMAGLRAGSNSFRLVTGILWGVFGTSLTLYVAAWLRQRLQHRRRTPTKLGQGVTYASG